MPVLRLAACVRDRASACGGRLAVSSAAGPKTLEHVRRYVRVRGGRTCACTDRGGRLCPQGCSGGHLFVAFSSLVPFGFLFRCAFISFKTHVLAADRFAQLQLELAVHALVCYSCPWVLWRAVLVYLLVLTSLSSGARRPGYTPI